MSPARDVPRDGLGVDGVEELRRALTVRAWPYAVYETVRSQGVLDGEPLAEKLRVPRELSPRRLLGEYRVEAGGRPHRDGGLPDEHCALDQVRQEGGERSVDVAKVGAVAIRALRGSDREEVDLGVRGVREVRAEAQPSRPKLLTEQFVEAGLEERGASVGEGGDLCLVHVDADDVVPERRHARRVNGTKVTAANDRESHDEPFCLTHPTAADMRRTGRRNSP